MIPHTQKYLRDFIQNSRLLTALDLIEAHLGVSVVAKASTEVSIAGIQHDHLPIFLYNQNSEDYTHEGALFHELMHLSLHIEGWPILDYGEGFYELKAKFPKNAEWITDTLWDIFSHTEIYRREKLCGFSSFQEREVDNYINTLMPDLPKLCLGWRQHVELLNVIPALLAPASLDMHTRLSEGLEAHLPPTAYRQVEIICRGILERQQFFPQSIPAVFEEVAFKLKLPQKLVAPYHLPKTAPGFFGEIQRIFRKD